MKILKITIPFLLLLFLSELDAQLVLQRCDRTNLWSGSNSLSTDTNDKKEGIASLKFTGSGINWFSKKFSQAYSGIDESGYLSLWLYVSNPSSFSGDGQIEITSSGGPDTDEYSWGIASLGLKSGWNELVLPVSSATKSGNPDLNAINFFRIYQDLSASITAKIDDIRLNQGDTPVQSSDPLAIQPVDVSSLDGKVMFGYQGWFLHPNDGSVFARWKHWGGSMSSPEELTVDMFPDFREYEADELYPTGGFSYADGRPVKVYSAYTKKTVMRHMKWLRDYSLDGVFLQRFMTSIKDEPLRRSRDTVTANVMDGCEKYGRVFANMWDISGYAPGNPNGIINDWKHLVDDLKVTESPNYLHHRGYPLVAIWGYTVRDEFPESDLQALLDFFKGESTPEKYRATVMLGVDHDFHLKTAWYDELAQADVISPWAVGRFSNDNGQESFMNAHVLPGQDWCDQRNVDFLPVIWPGFSWYNLHDGPKNQTPRRGGNFFWTQATRVISGNAKSVYIAMFDEVDESTAMYKLAENDEQTPDQGYWLPLDEDGYNLPSDWYLRCARLATEIVRGNTANRTSLGTPPDGIDAFGAGTVAAHCGADDGSLTLSYPLTDAENKYEFSIDGGKSYPYLTPAGTSEMKIDDLAKGIYNIWVRNEDQTYPTDLGPYTIFDAEPFASVFGKGATCSEKGMLHFLLKDLPYAGEVQLSIDGGQNYILTSAKGSWRDTIDNLEAGSYTVWIRFEDGSCPRELETKTIGTNVQSIEVIPMLDGVQLTNETDTLYACPGSSLLLFCSPSDIGLSWTINGPNGFSSDSRTVQVSNSLTQEMFGTYEIAFTSTSGCDIHKNFILLLGEDCELNTFPGSQMEQSLELFPNPASHYILIQNHFDFSCMLDMTDVSGRKILDQIKVEPGQNRIDLSLLAQGVYYVSLHDGKGNRIQKSFIRSID